MDDSILVDLFLHRDEMAIEKTAQKYGTRLHKISYGILEDDCSAQECVNDTYFTAWNSIPPHEPRTYLFAFLAKITRHISLDRCKERNRIKRSGCFVELTLELEQCIPSQINVVQQLEAQELSKIISNFLRTKSTQKRNIFIRRYWYMDSITDIAKRFKIGESKVKTTLFRMRNELKKYLEMEDYTL